MVPFIATLAMLASARGLALQITDGKTQIVTVESVLDLGLPDSYILGIPPLVIMFAVVTVVGWLILNRTTFGRRTVAVGGNAEAARLAGIDVRRQRLYLYLLSGLCCGIAAFMLIVLAYPARTPTATCTSSTPSPPRSSAGPCSAAAGAPSSAPSSAS